MKAAPQSRGPSTSPRLQRSPSTLTDRMRQYGKKRKKQSKEYVPLQRNKRKLFICPKCNLKQSKTSKHICPQCNQKMKQERKAQSKHTDKRTLRKQFIESIKDEIEIVGGATPGRSLLKQSENMTEDVLHNLIVYANYIKIISFLYHNGQLIKYEWFLYIVYTIMATSIILLIVHYDIKKI